MGITKYLSEVLEEMVSHARKHASALICMNNQNSFESVAMSTIVDHKKTFRELRKYVEW